MFVLSAMINQLTLHINKTIQINNDIIIVNNKLIFYRKSFIFMSLNASFPMIIFAFYKYLRRKAIYQITMCLIASISVQIIFLIMISKRNTIKPVFVIQNSNNINNNNNNINNNMNEMKKNEQKL